MPSASDSTATMVKTGLRRRVLSPKRKSFHMGQLYRRNGGRAGLGRDLRFSSDAPLPSRFGHWVSAPRPCGAFLVLVLQLVQLPVNPAQRQQLLVRAGFAQLAFVHHQNAVGALDRRQPVRDDDRRAPFHHAGQRVAHAKLGLGIDARSGFVQNQEARIVRQRAGEADELLLPGGQRAAALADGLLEAIRQRVDEVHQVHLLGRRLDLLARDACRCRAGYCPRCVPVNRYGSCSTTPKLPAQLQRIDVADIHAADANAALLNVVEAQQQADERGLAGAGVAHHGDRLAGLDAEADVAQHPVFVLVGEPDVIELDRRGRVGQALRRAPERRSPPACRAV